jgi:hypothetical protein
MMKAENDRSDVAPRPVGVAEAAAHLGISTLRVRHHLKTGALKGYRDNRGHWQVRIDGGDVASGPSHELSPETLTDMLVDELLEAKDRIDEQDQAIDRLRGIVERQQKLLDRTLARLEALSAATPGTDTADRLRNTLDRVIALLETSLQQHEAANARAERFRGMMERAIQLLEKVEPEARTAAAHDGRIAGALDKAMDVGAKAVEHAEISTHHAAQLDGMLERALAVAEHNVQTQNETERRLAGRDALLERSFALIEQASARGRGGVAARRSLFAFFSRKK